MDYSPALWGEKTHSTFPLKIYSCQPGGHWSHQQQTSTHFIGSNSEFGVGKRAFLPRFHHVYFLTQLSQREREVLKRVSSMIQLSFCGFIVSQKLRGERIRTQDPGQVDVFDFSFQRLCEVKPGAAGGSVMLVLIAL